MFMSMSGVRVHVPFHGYDVYARAHAHAHVHVHGHVDVQAKCSHSRTLNMFMVKSIAGHKIVKALTDL